MAPTRRQPSARRRATVPTAPRDTLPDPERTVVRECIYNIFCPAFLSSLIESPPSKYRARKLTIEVVSMAMLEFVLRRLPAYLQVLDRLRAGKIPGVDARRVTEQAFYQRLDSLPHTIFLRLLEAASSCLNQEQKYTRAWVTDLAPFVSGIYAIDDTTLDAVARRTKLLREKKKGDAALLAGRLGSCIDLLTGKFAQLVYDRDAMSNEKNHFRPLVEGLEPRAMLVFDLGYFSFDLFDWITEQGHFFVTRMRKQATFIKRQTLASSNHYRDQIVWLGKPRNPERAGHPMRLVELQIDGVWYSYLTNVLDPSQLSAKNLWKLYAQRWTIEMCFAAVKRALKLSQFRSGSDNALLIQVWSTLLVYQVLQDLRLEIACTQGWHEDDVSWLMLMYRIGWYAERNDGLPLRDWLRQHASTLFLKKRGTRKRRLTELPPEVLAECEPPPPDPGDDARCRRKSAKRPRPRKASVLVRAGLN